MEKKNISLEEANLLIKTGFGFFQFVKKEKFTPALIGATSNSINIYNDNLPDGVDNLGLAYKIKVKIPYQEIVLITIDKLKKNKELKRFMRLNIICKDVNNSKFFYFKKSEKGFIKQLLKVVKHKHVKVKKRKVDVSYNY